MPYQGESSDDEVENSAVKSANNGTKQAEKPTDPSPKSDATRSPVKSGEPVLDSRLQTTLTVPGAYKSLDQGEPRSFSKEKAQERAESPVKHRSSAGSPVKRGLVPLSVSCPLTPTSKLNATTPWQVLDADAQMSPSLASGSSCNSVNSTTEWQVSQEWKVIVHIDGLVGLMQDCSNSIANAGVDGAVRLLVVGTSGKEERPPRRQLWMEQYLISIKYWPI